MLYKTNTNHLYSLRLPCYLMLKANNVQCITDKITNILQRLIVEAPLLPAARGDAACCEGRRGGRFIIHNPPDRHSRINQSGTRVINLFFHIPLKVHPFIVFFYRYKTIRLGSVKNRDTSNMGMAYELFVENLKN